jgi:hypothetical protein
MVRSKGCRVVTVAQIACCHRAVMLLQVYLRQFSKECL